MRGVPGTAGPAWQAATYREAVRLCRDLTDPPAGFSVQAWTLKAKLGAGQ